ncbi:MAG TPA: NUDIX domain-containing protein [Bacillota bacterium]|nr:NUDIX domain-containing protein [Bacillota bacterium]
MKLLKRIIRKQGIKLDGKTIYRKAVRGVIVEGRTLLMVYSSKDGDYKFPGGGVKSGETYEESLIREVNEECGATVLSIDDELGKVIELDIAKEEEYDVFKMVSYYYMCGVDPELRDQSLDQYEKDLGLTPVWVDIDKAILANQLLIDSDNFSSWTPREAFILKYIKEKLSL